MSEVLTAAAAFSTARTGGSCPADRVSTALPSPARPPGHELGEDRRVVVAGPV